MDDENVLLAHGRAFSTVTSTAFFIIEDHRLLAASGGSKGASGLKSPWVVSPPRQKPDKGL